MAVVGFATLSSVLVGRLDRGETVLIGMTDWHEEPRRLLRTASRSVDESIVQTNSRAKFSQGWQAARILGTIWG